MGDRESHAAGDLSDLEMVERCAKAMGFQQAAGDHGAPLWFDPSTSPSAGFFEYDPIHIDAQKWALADRFPLVASGVLSAVAIARHDGETDPRMVDAGRLLVECIAKGRR